MKPICCLFILLPLMANAQINQPGDAWMNGMNTKSASVISSDTSDLYWDDQFGPTGLGGNDCIVYASAVDGQSLYIGGAFLYAGGKTVNHIARWNGSEWETLGAGTDGEIYSLTVHAGKVFAGGRFTMAGGVPANNIAMWDGSQWQSLGEGITGTVSWSTGVNALAFVGDKLYAGGDFSTAGSLPVSNIACWNGSQWEAVAGGVNDVVRALCSSGNDLYAGGDFHWAGPVTGGTWAHYVAKFNGISWSSLGSGMDDAVYAMAVNGSNIYAGGMFSTSGGITTNHVAMWDGSQWNPLQDGVMSQSENSAVNAFAFIGNMLYVAGSFDITSSPFDLINISKWDGSGWSDCGYGLIGYQMYTTAYTISAIGNNIYCGGYFKGSGTTSMRNFGMWDGSQWHATGTGFGKGMDSYVNKVLAVGDDLWVGGMFEQAGDTPAHYIAKWDGTQWTEPFNGTSYEVKDLMQLGNDLYVAGGFTYVGNQMPAGGIARWDGTSWHALGNGFTSTVYAMEHIGTDIYVGRSGAVVNKWDGNQWTLIGTLGGTVEGVKDLAVIGSDLYAGGTFTDANGIPANYVAKWDGTQWTPLGSGMNQRVMALCVVGGDLYAGGWFTSAGGTEAKYLARWDGSQWHAVGGGMNAEVSGLANIDGQLYVGGRFTMAGTVAANHIACWNGSNWKSFGSGVSSEVFSFTKAGDDLFVGGYFESAGSKSSAFIGRWLKYPVTDINEGGVVTDEFTVSPNPASTEIRISLNQPVERSTSIQIEDMMGRKVRSFREKIVPLCHQEVNVDITGLKPGMYLVRLYTQGRSACRKLLVGR